MPSKDHWETVYSTKATDAVSWYQPHAAHSLRLIEATGVPPGAAIIDVGGFLGIGAKPVAVPLTDLEFMRDEDGEVHAVTTWTKDQLKDMPEHHH